MNLPSVNAVGRGLNQQIEFKGLNHNMYVGENQFFDTYNLCATNYPVMTPRAKRALVGNIAGAQGLYARGKLCWAAGNKLYYDGAEVAGVTLTAGEKTFVGQGAYILVFPDGVRYNVSTGQADRLNASWALPSGETATVSMARMSGEDYNNVTVSATAPTDPQVGDYWLDTSAEPNTLKVYSSAGVWSVITTTYARIEKTGIGSAFRAGDAVTFAGTNLFDGSHVLTAVDDDWLLIPYVMGHATETLSALTVTRSFPVMDYCCELNNRVWGCSSAAHEIYCSKLGDATNWDNLGTGAADAWRATIGTDGDFTGCCAYAGAVLFWKENVLHKVMGTKPSNFQVMDSVIRGVQKGSEKSLAIVNEALMYKSVDGVMVYDGATPTNVGDALGIRRLFDARAGVDGDRYYISMRTEDNVWGMWVFNEAKGMWHREDGTRAEAFAALNGQLYFLRDNGDLVAVRGRQEAGAALEEDFDWWAETGDMLLETPESKYVTRIMIRGSVELGSTLTIEAMYDSSGTWERIYKKGKMLKGSFTIPLIPRRCDHVRLKIGGHGKGAIYSISKETEMGSDVKEG